MYLLRLAVNDCITYLVHTNLYLRMRHDKKWGALTFETTGA